MERNQAIDLQVGLHHHISNDLMIYPGYVPREGTEPILLHYGLKFSVGNWSFSKGEHYDDNIAYDCNRLFPPPPYPKEVIIDFVAVHPGIQFLVASR